MTLSTQELMQNVRQNCLEQTEIIADCFNRALDFKESFTVAELSSFDESALERFWLESGILVVLETGSGGGVLVALPSNLPLPTWVHHPDESQASRMGTLGMEWSMSIMPEEFQGTGFCYHLVKNMQEAIKRAEMVEDAQFLKLELTDSQKPIFILGPMLNLTGIPDPVTEKIVTSKEMGTPQSNPEPVDLQQLEVYQRVQRIRRLIQLKVPVIVNLAEKKIQLKHLTSMSPGMLITFDKSCDDLIDLYVNNQLFCRGEAVKIGENFGIKINEVGSQVTEESGILVI